MARVVQSINVFDANGLLLGNGAPGSTNLVSSATVARVLTLPDATDTLVGRATVDTLTNKTIIDNTNNVAANSLKTTGAVVNVAASAPPTLGQILVATGATTATWQDVSIPGTSFSTGAVTTSTATATNIQTIATTDNTVYTLTITIVGRRTDTPGQGAGYTVRATYQRVAGAASLARVGSTIDDTLSFESVAAWNVATVANTGTGNIEIQVTGQVGSTISWKSSTSVVSN